VWLVDELSRLHPGSIVPPLPERQIIGRFSTQFIERRRKALERFIMRVFEHRTLGVSESLVTFAQGSDSALAEGGFCFRTNGMNNH